MAAFDIHQELRNALTASARNSPPSTSPPASPALSSPASSAQDVKGSILGLFSQPAPPQFGSPYGGFGSFGVPPMYPSQAPSPMPMGLPQPMPMGYGQQPPTQQFGAMSMGSWFPTSR
eukprot:GAFH01002628.1.p5 GENE.GAFH01002628.1~~GAFH01002628.1.p5  ORF type:complete len:118 (-),score=36.70 GAFH01002628.1:40-393(-)